MALQNKFKMNLNTKEASNKFIPVVTANDTTIFEFEVYDGKDKIELLETYNFNFVTKPVGKGSVLYPAELNEDGNVVVELNFADVNHGHCDCALVMYEGEKRVSTMRMKVDVKGDLALQGNLPSESRRLIIADEDQLTMAVETANDVRDAIGDAESLTAKFDTVNIKINDKASVQEVATLNTNLTSISKVVESNKTELSTGIDTVSSQLIHTKADLDQRAINPKTLGAKGDRVNNDRQAIVDAIAILNPTLTSEIVGWNTINGGVVQLPAGHFLINDTIMMKSNITIQGAGIGKTLLIPSFRDRSKYMFDVSGVGASEGNRLFNFELKDLSIVGKSSDQVSMTNLTEEEMETRAQASGINFSYTSSCRLRNVFIGGLGGTALNMTEHYDSNINNLQMLGSGSIGYPSMIMTTGVRDGVNALHMEGCRFEKNHLMQIVGKEGKLQREIQISNAKIETCTMEISGTPMVSFCNSHFTWNGATPMISMANAVDTEAYGVTFSSCTFLNTTSEGVLFRNTANSLANPTFIGCTFKGFASTFSGTGGGTFMSSLFYYCKAPVISGNTNTIVNGCTFRGTRGAAGDSVIEVTRNSNISNNTFVSPQVNTMYAVKLTGADNQVCFNDGNGGFTTFGFIATASTGNVLFANNGKFTGESTTWHASQNYIPKLGLKIPHNTSETIIGGMKYDINSKQFTVNDGTANQNVSFVRTGDTSSRPATALRFVGMPYFDTTLGKPIYWNGTAWVDSTGTTV